MTPEDLALLERHLRGQLHGIRRHLHRVPRHVVAQELIAEFETKDRHRVGRIAAAAVLLAADKPGTEEEEAT